MSPGAPDVWLLSRCKTESVKFLCWFGSSPVAVTAANADSATPPVAMTDWPQTASPASATRPAHESEYWLTVMSRSSLADEEAIRTPPTPSDAMQISDEEEFLSLTFNCNVLMISGN